MTNTDPPTSGRMTIHDTVVLGVGKTFVLEKLTAALHNGKGSLPLLLCGPPGCGKKCLVHAASKAAGYDLTLYDVSAITFETKYYDKAAKKERSTDHSEDLRTSSRKSSTSMEDIKSATCSRTRRHCCASTEQSS